MNLTINITANDNAVVNVYNQTATPYRTVQDKEGLLHTFYSKESYEEYTQALKEQE